MKKIEDIILEATTKSDGIRKKTYVVEIVVDFDNEMDFEGDDFTKKSDRVGYVRGVIAISIDAAQGIHRPPMHPAHSFEVKRVAEK